MFLSLVFMGKLSHPEPMSIYNIIHHGFKITINFKITRVRYTDESEINIVNDESYFDCANRVNNLITIIISDYENVECELYNLFEAFYFNIYPKVSKILKRKRKFKHQFVVLCIYRNYFLQFREILINLSSNKKVYVENCKRDQSSNFNINWKRVFWCKTSFKYILQDININIQTCLPFFENLF